MPRRVANINLPGIQIPVWDTTASWQFATFLYYGYEPTVETYFFWREVSDGDETNAVLNEDASLSVQELGDDSGDWNSNVASAEFSSVETGDTSSTWTKLQEFHEGSGED